MTVSNPWARHYQTSWQERAGDARLPQWLRVAALAYGSHRQNGHAPFDPGQIGVILGRVDPRTGEVRPLAKQNVQRAISKAIEFGWLLPESGSTCLVVPGHAVAGGGSGAPGDICPQRHPNRSGNHQTMYLRASGTSPDDYPVHHQTTTHTPSDLRKHLRSL